MTDRPSKLKKWKIKKHIYGSGSDWAENQDGNV